MLTKPAPTTLRWQRTNYSLLRRQLDIFSAAAKVLFFWWWDTVFGNPTEKQRYKRAQWFVSTLLNLGPTFIKIGQALSTRADLLPLEYVKALGQLQDRVPEFDAGVAIALIESELAGSLYSLYRDFDRFPIAAASLGQVHKARLHTGEDVVVKVQRPGLKQLFDLDFRVLRQLLDFCKRYLPGAKEYDLDAIYSEFFTILYQEIDYLQEGKNADRFRQNFIQQPLIRVPQIYWRYTTSKILTMEYVPGIKVTEREALEAAKVDVKAINQLGICCYLKQLLQDGFFHADPHPGNMAVNPQGQLVFYDFGMMADVKSVDRDQMVKTFFAVLRKDPDEVISTLTEMGLIERVSDKTAIRRLMKFILDKFTEKPLELQDFNQMRSEIYTVFEQQPFRLPAKMTFILKSLTTLDGIARALDPQYNLLAAAKPFVKNMAIAQTSGGGLGSLARQAREFIQYRLRQPSATERILQRLEDRLEQGEIQIRVKNIESDRALKQIHLAIKSLIYACLSGFTLLVGAVLLVGSYQGWAIAAFGVGGIAFISLLRSLLELSVREKLNRFAEKA